MGVGAEAPAPVIDTGYFLKQTEAGINLKSNSAFFQLMKERASTPGEYFAETDMPNGGKLILYYPDGMKSTPRVGVRKSVTNSQITQDGQTLNQTVTDEAVILDVEQDGTLGANATIDILDPNEIEIALKTYLIEPTAVKARDWTITDADATDPAKVFKINAEDPNDITYYGGDQHGFIVSEHNYTQSTPIVPANSG